MYTQSYALASAHVDAIYRQRMFWGLDNPYLTQEYRDACRIRDKLAYQARQETRKAVEKACERRQLPAPTQVLVFPEGTILALIDGKTRKGHLDRDRVRILDTSCKL